ncbi:hypothetical protein BDQ17DRAFT_1437153 [Cyathus striatus]|nr:hypothetical protein BDQ17DRAFT_1437153 [Cyathus striatus]
MPEPLVTNLGISQSEITVGGTITVTWTNPTGKVENTVMTIMPIPTSTCFPVRTATLFQVSTLEIQVPLNATPGVVSFEAVDSVGDTIPGGNLTAFQATILNMITSGSEHSISSISSSVIESSFDPVSRLSIASSTFSSRTTITSPGTTISVATSQGSKAFASAGAIVGRVVGAIGGIAIISLGIWFIRNRKSRSGTMQKQSALLFNRKTTEGNDRILELFDLRPDMEYSNTISAPILSANNFIGMVHSDPSEEVVQKRRDLPAELSTAEPPLSNVRRGSYFVPSSTPRRELDAGPIGFEYRSEGEATLPPNYSDVFARSRSSSETTVPLPSTSNQKS